MGSVQVLPVPLSPKRPCHPLKSTPRKGTVSPCVIQGILKLCCLIPGLCPPSPLEYHQTHRCDPSDDVDFLNFTLWALGLIKTCGSQPLSFFQSILLQRRVFLVQSPACCILSTTPNLCNQGSLPFTLPAVLFSPKPTLCSPYCPRGGCFSTCRCAVLFSQSPDWFLGCSQWFDIYLAVFKEQGKPTVPLHLHHLNTSLYVLSS